MALEIYAAGQGNRALGAFKMLHRHCMFRAAEYQTTKAPMNMMEDKQTPHNQLIIPSISA